MRLRYLMGIAAASVALSQPATAFDKDPFEKLESINPEVLFKGIIREDDVTLLFQHLRESMAAAARGEEAQESEAVKRRTEAIQREVAARASVAAGALLSALESAAKQMVREGLSEFSTRVPVPPASPSPRSSPNNQAQ